MLILYIIEVGTCLKKDGEQLLIVQKNEIKEKIPLYLIEAVIVIGKISISSSVIEAFLKININLIWVDKVGKYLGKIENTKNLNIERQFKQYNFYNKDIKKLQVSKQFIYGKARNQNEILKRYNRNLDNCEIKGLINIIKVNIKNIESSKSIEQLMGIEGYISKNYFKAIKLIIPEQFNFKKRINRGATDPVNAVLNFGYTLLLFEIHNIICAKGLNAYIPIMHKMRNGHNALASDLMEEWRPIIIDTMVINMFKNNEILLDDFKESEDGKILIKDDALKKIVNKYQNKIMSSHKFIKNDKQGQTYKTTIQNQINCISNIVEEKEQYYNPIIIR